MNLLRVQARCFGYTGRLLVMALVVCLTGAAGQPADDESTPLEYRVKAAFLLNFTKFIQWPAAAFANAGSPFTICILGDDPFGNSLNRIVEGETIEGRGLVVQKLRRPPAAKACQVLFLGRSEKDQAAILSGAGQGVLTVGEGDNFIREGGMIRFVVDSRRVRFDINQGAAEAAALTISSKLLSVARTVQR